MQNTEALTPVEYERIPFSDWRAMWFDYLGAHSGKLPAEVHQHTFDRIRLETSGLRGFAVSSARPIGFVHFYFHPSSYCLHDACTIEDLYVSPEFRGRGVGRWLIERVADIARAASAPALHWKTGPSNASAIALYQQLAQQVDVLTFRKPL